MTAVASNNSASLYVANALGGATTFAHGEPVAGHTFITRVNLALHGTRPPRLVSSTVIGIDFLWKANASAFVLAPTGLAMDNGTLYVVDALTDTLSAISHAGSRTVPVTASSDVITSRHFLSVPLGLVTLPNGHLFAVNGNNGNAVEISASGTQLLSKTVIRNGAGDLFGPAVAPGGMSIYVVDDGTNDLDLYTGS
jgi:DNA-binding beta-propeller fold protein YncE